MLPVAVLLLLFTLNIRTPAQAAPRAEHVIVIGVDGLGSAGLLSAETPTLRQMMQSGASTLKARAVMPTSSSPNWASMIMGAPPAEHGVTSNDWEPHKFERAPTTVGSGGIFPTIFGTVREQRPDAKIGVLYDWKGFGRLLETNAPNLLIHVKDAIETAEAGIKYFRTNRPAFLFLHFDGVDHAGHAFGWNGLQYRRTVEMTDALIQGVLDVVEETGLKERTAILVTADHGGMGKSHGRASLDELEIPWILVGPGVAAGRALTGPVNTYDTAPTLAHLLGVKPPAAWVGKPVLEAFVNVPKAP